jgi:hypothetical protein
MIKGSTDEVDPLSNDVNPAQAGLDRLDESMKYYFL